MIVNSGATTATLTVTEGISFSGTIAGSIALTFPSGHHGLSGINHYTGPTTINGGLFFVTGSLAPTGDVFVNRGATLGGTGSPIIPNSGRVGNVTMQPGSVLDPGTVFTVSNLTVNGGEMRFTRTSDGVMDRVNVIGAATFNGPSTILLHNAVPGSYPLLTADTLSGTAPTLDVPSGTRATFGLNFDTQGDQIRLIVGGAASKALAWTGTNGSEWDLNKTANWTDGAAAEKFFNLDFARFTDGPANRTVTLNTTVLPAGVTVDNSVGNEYTITGTGTIGDSHFGNVGAVYKFGSGTLTLGGSTTYNGSLSIIVGLVRTTGSIAINNTVFVEDSEATFAVEGTATVGNLVAGSGGVTKVGDGTAAAMLTANHIRGPSLTIGNGGTVVIRPNGGPGGTSVLRSLSIFGTPAAPLAKFDLNNNATVLNYSDATPIDTVRQQILAGRGGAGLGKAWNGQGITSSTAGAANAAEPESRSIGYAENSALPLGRYTNFRGQAVNDTSVLIAFTRTGDANLDGVVNDEDVTIVGATYAPGVSNSHWALGDFDYNGFVDDDDVTLLGVFYDPTATPLAVPASAPATNVAAVPEPSTFGLLATMSVVALFVMRYRRLTTAGESLTTGLHGDRIL